MNVCSNIPNAKFHPFLFVAHKRGAYQGRPLSESSFKSRGFRGLPFQSFLVKLSTGFATTSTIVFPRE
jgi:hypothetical protein